MSGDPDDYVELVLPVLITEARRSFGLAIRGRLNAAGFDDMPPTGARVIGRISVGGTTIGEVATAYGASKQAGSQLVDTLVARGYVRRVPDESDRRRMGVALTDRGQAAADEIREAIESIEAALFEAVGAQDVQVMRRGLAAIAARRG